MLVAFKVTVYELPFLATVPTKVRLSPVWVFWLAEIEQSSVEETRASNQRSIPGRGS